MHDGPCLPDRQCASPVAACWLCGGELYREDTVYQWEGSYLCPACLEDKFRVMTIQEKAALLGAYPCPADKLTDGRRKEREGNRDIITR